MNLARGVGVALLGMALALALLGAGERADAAVPPGPRLTFMEVDLDRLDLSLRSVDAEGGGVRVLFGGALGGAVKPPMPAGSPPSWSADGSRMALAGLDQRRQEHVYVIDGEGRAPKKLPKTRGSEFAVFSPDGRQVAFARIRAKIESATTWVIDLQTGQVRQLTRWRRGRQTVPVSFSPDGQAVAATSHVGGRRLAVAIDLATGRSSVLERNAASPVFSPDGTRLAFASFRSGHRLRHALGTEPAADLYVRSLSDGSLTRLTSTPHRSESEPSWDPSGERLAYSQTFRSRHALFGASTVLMQVNADGSCARDVYGNRAWRVRMVGNPAWQLGAGREAGRIIC